MSSSFLSNYELAEPTIRKLYDSKLRLAILDSLDNGPMRLADLRRAINANAPNTSAKAKELEDMGLLERVSGEYALTPYGKAVRARAEEAFKFYSTYEKFKKFWEENVVTEIPDYLWKRLGDLNDSHVVRMTAQDVTKVHDEFVEFLNSIKEKFYGVSPIFHDEYLDAANMLIKKGVDTQLVLTEKVLKTCAKEGGKETAELWDNADNMKIFSVPDTTLAFTVSESYLSMAIRSKHIPDSYQHSDFQSANPLAVKWGIDLFESCKQRGKSVKLSDYL